MGHVKNMQLIETFPRYVSLVSVTALWFIYFTSSECKGVFANVKDSTNDKPVKFERSPVLTEIASLINKIEELGNHRALMKPPVSPRLVNPRQRTQTEVMQISEEPKLPPARLEEEEIKSTKRFKYIERKLKTSGGSQVGLRASLYAILLLYLLVFIMLVSLVFLFCKLRAFSTCPHQDFPLEGVGSSKGGSTAFLEAMKVRSARTDSTSSCVSPYSRPPSRASLRENVEVEEVENTRNLQTVDKVTKERSSLFEVGSNISSELFKVLTQEEQKRLSYLDPRLDPDTTGLKEKLRNAKYALDNGKKYPIRQNDNLLISLRGNSLDDDDDDECSLVTVSTVSSMTSILSTSSSMPTSELFKPSYKTQATQYDVNYRRT